MVAIENLQVFFWSADVRLISAPYTMRNLHVLGLFLPASRVISFVMAETCCRRGPHLPGADQDGLRRARDRVRPRRRDADGNFRPQGGPHRLRPEYRDRRGRRSRARPGVRRSFPGFKIVWISKAFLVVILGGVDNILGLFVAAMVLGVAENVTGVMAPAYVVDFVAYILLIGTLMVRPRGLMRRAGT